MEEFLAMESLKGKMCGENLHDNVSGITKRYKLPWSTLINVIKDGSPNLTGKNLGFNKESG